MIIATRCNQSFFALLVQHYRRKYNLADSRRMCMFGVDANVFDFIAIILQLYYLSTIENKIFNMAKY